MKFRVSGLDAIKEFIKELPRGSKIEAMRAAAIYLIGDANRGLKHNPPRREHGENNPYRWTSEKQRKAFFATDGFGGGIPYARTGDLSSAWNYQETNSDWTRVDLINDAPHFQYVQGEDIQIGHKVDGWRYYLDVISTNITGAIRSAQQAVDRFIKSKG